MIAGRHRAHAGPDLDDDAGPFMPQDGREHAFRVLPREGELVGVADSGRLHLDQDLTFFRPLELHGLDLQRLARLERNVALFTFTVGYLAVVLVPINFGWVGHGDNTRMYWVPGQVISGTVLLLGAIGFALARRRQR